MKSSQQVVSNLLSEYKERKQLTTIDYIQDEDRIINMPPDHDSSFDNEIMR
jgi:hypothetical protein